MESGETKLFNRYIRSEFLLTLPTDRPIDRSNQSETITIAQNDTGLVELVSVMSWIGARYVGGTFGGITIFRLYETIVTDDNLLK